MPGESHNFDTVARPYRWLERLTLGRALERAREHFLPALQRSQTALVIGDGDGRFLAMLLAGNPTVEADVVDTSEAMLALLERRCAPYAERIRLHRADAMQFEPTTRYDLICTHFFLDCLTQHELESLADRLVPALAGDRAMWLVSDFRVPPAGLLHWPARLFIRALYLAFRILTGLRVTRLPDHEHVFVQMGLTRTAHWLSLGGVITSELWRKNPGAIPR